jgi:dihydrofolate reductase
MISIIAAIASNGVIGDRNRLLWHISEDLKRFKAITSGHPVVMGRKTFESLRCPLPGRTNVVITRNSAYNAEGVKVAVSLVEAVALFPDNEEIFVIGGGEIYAQAFPVADKLYLTLVEYPYEGDTVFPEWDRSQWQLTEEERIPHGEKFECPFTYLTYVRKK